jgi:hypothetical protein
MPLSVPPIAVKNDADMAWNWMSLDLAVQSMLIGSVEGRDCPAYQPRNCSTDYRGPLEESRLAEVHQQRLIETAKATTT